MATIWTRSSVAARLLSVLAAGASAGCAKAPDAVPPATRTSDYEVYSAVLREHLISPERDEHGDGLEPACEANLPLDPVMIVRETRFRREGGQSRDSALAAELEADAVPLFTALRGMDRLPPRALEADSFSLGVPVLLVDSADTRRTPDGWGPITLSRVAFNADSTRAIVHAVKPCRREPDPPIDESERGADGRAFLVALDRQEGVWKVGDPVWLYAE